MSLVNASKDPKSALARRYNWHPMGRGGSPEEVAEFCLFLISNRANWMTGQNIALDGGYTAR
jgi:NAD(P)-dependent dehydrogenase (short-subunit alcohol dehydrogenase family)